MQPTPRTRKGFSLIELMVTVAIVAIIAAIALPSYRDQVRKSRRATAQSCLAEMAQFMERFYTTNMQYHQDRSTTPVAVALPALTCTNELADIYTFSVAPTQTAYVLTAAIVANGPQDGDPCGTLTISNTGARTPSSPDSCWQR